MRAVNNDQIWTHIVKGGVLAFGSCAYFKPGNSGSVPSTASKKMIIVTILVTILAWTMVSAYLNNSRNIFHDLNSQSAIAGSK